MRCDCCDKRLSGYESVLKHAVTGEYLNTCVKCLDGLGIAVAEQEIVEEIDQDNVEDFVFNIDRNDDESWG